MKEEFEIETLKQIGLFSSLANTELRKISEKIIIKKFLKNELILSEDQTAEFMYIILDGEAKVVQTTEKGKTMILTLHSSGDFFGELSLIDGKTTPASVWATKNSVVAIIPKENFHSLLCGESKVLDNLLRILCDRFRESLKKIEMLNFNNAAQRIKMVLMMLSEKHGEKSSDGTALTIKLIHQDIADMTGLTRETVTRIFDRWQRTGEIKILKNKHIMLPINFNLVH